MSDKKLWDQYVALEKERDTLRAKIAEMEKQEPIGEIVAFGEFLHEPSWKRGKLPHLGTKLYALPGAAPEPSESEARMRWLLRQIVHALPSRRDWLDPAIEREARIATTPDANHDPR